VKSDFGIITLPTYVGQGPYEMMGGVCLSVRLSVCLSQAST